MKLYDINYTELSDGTVLAQWKDSSDDESYMSPTYQKLFKNLDAAIAYIDEENQI